MRRFWAILLNLICPGAGLIILRREWLGSLLSFVFAALCSTGFSGILLIPLLIPRWLSLICLALALSIWVMSQWLLSKRIRETCCPGIDEEVENLCMRAQEAMEADEPEKAQQLLQVALSINDEDVDVNICWATLMTQMKQYDVARSAWNRVKRLHRTDSDRKTATDALEALPS